MHSPKRDTQLITVIIAIELLLGWAGLAMIPFVVERIQTGKWDFRGFITDRDGIAYLVACALMAPVMCWSAGAIARLIRKHDDA